jgi:hypothetical protein
MPSSTGSVASAANAAPSYQHFTTYQLAAGAEPAGVTAIMDSVLRECDGHADKIESTPAASNVGNALDGLTSQCVPPTVNAQDSGFIKQALHGNGSGY